MQRTGRSYEHHRALRLVALLLATSAASCATIGPKTIPRDQFDYGKAITNSGKEQLLANVVGLRYVEAPVFVNVSSVINQYSLEGEVALGGGINSSISGGDTMSVGAAGRYADRPTITYTPIAGQEFARSLLTAIPPEAIFALVQAGWPPEVILRLTVRSMNGIDNAWAGPAHRKQGDPRYKELLQVWGRLRRARVVGLRSQKEDSGRSKIIVYTLSEAITAEIADDLRFLHETLGLDPDAREFMLSYGLLPDEKNEIAVLTSSVLEIMNELAWRIDAPQEHIDEGRTGTTFVEDGAEGAPLIRIHHSKDRPEDAFVAIPNRDYWFYIDDRDVVSKRTFAMVQIILSLTDSGDAARGPVVSISN